MRVQAETILSNQQPILGKTGTVKLRGMSSFLNR
jgi:hypothetical protein